VEVFDVSVMHRHREHNATERERETKRELNKCMRNIRENGDFSPKAPIMLIKYFKIGMNHIVNTIPISTVQYSAVQCIVFAARRMTYLYVRIDWLAPQR
jgi:hypothetical protein